jgi:hypothetical protein
MSHASPKTGKAKVKRRMEGFLSIAIFVRE